MSVLADVDGILKTIYKSGNLAVDPLFKDSPSAFLNRIKKETSVETAGGRKIRWPFAIMPNAAASHTDSVALAASFADPNTAFEMELSPDYVRAWFYNQDLETGATKGVASFKAMLKFKVDNALQALTNRLARELILGKNALGKINALSVGNTVVTLDDSTQAINFLPGQTVQFSASATGTSGALLSQTTKTVSSVDWTAGTVTFTAAVTTISGVVSGVYMYSEGDFGKGMLGIADYIPTTTPDSTSFLGVDRTSQPGMSGVRTTHSDSDILAAIRENAMEIQRAFGGRPDVVMINHQRWVELTGASPEDNRRFLNGEDKGKAGFSSYTIAVNGGFLEILPERHVPYNRIWVVSMDSWNLSSLGDYPRILQPDGLMIRVIAGYDQNEVRIGGYGGLVCTHPHHNGVISLT